MIVVGAVEFVSFLVAMIGTNMGIYFPTLFTPPFRIAFGGAGTLALGVFLIVAGASVRTGAKWGLWVGVSFSFVALVRDAGWLFGIPAPTTPTTWVNVFVALSVLAYCTLRLTHHLGPPPAP